MAGYPHIHRRIFFVFCLLFSILQVLFNLADQYAANGMDNEALNTYQVIVKNKTFSNSGEFNSVSIGTVIVTAFAGSKSFT